MIKAVLNKAKYQLPTLPTPGEAEAKLSKRLASRVKEPDQKPKKASADELAWQAAGLHCSANERRADEASRDVEAWLKCKYMREHLGEEFGGVVTAATGFGLFVTLDAMYVEGLIHITELGGEYFRFDEARQELRGERTGIRYAIGTRVRVQVSRVDLDGRKIDFRLVNENSDVQAVTSRAMKDKMGGQSGDFAAGDRSNTPAPARSTSKARKASESGKNGGSTAFAAASLANSGGSKRSGARSASTVQRTDRAPVSSILSPIQSLKATAKKSAATTAGRKQGKKPRR